MKTRRIPLKMVIMLPLLCAVWLFAAFSGVTVHAVGDIPIDEAHFPDTNFRSYVSGKNIDKDQNSILSEDEIAAVTSIDIRFKSITNLTGIEYFVNLEELDCSRNNNIKALDVSKNIKLKSLNCSGNDLTELDVSKNTLLTSLDCSDNNLTALDVSKNTLLTSLDISGDRYKRTNRISNIDLSKNTKLTSLTTGSNGLTSLDISKNIALITLICYNDNLGTLDITKNTVLEKVYCPEINIKSLDLSQNTELKSLNCYGNSLTSLSISQNTNLEELIFYRNDLNTIDVSKNLKLNNLSCRDNKFSYIDIKQNINLETFDCSNNNFSSIDVSQNANLKTFDCSNNNFSSIDVSQNANLETFNCSNNSLNKIDVSNNGSLKYFYCGYNNLSQIDVHNNLKLGELNCNGNLLSELDVSQNALRRLYCEGNQLDELDISKNLSLQDLDCSNNRLTSLDVSNHKSIRRLECNNNNLPYIDVSNTKISSEYNLSASGNIYILPQGTVTFDTTAIPGFDKSKVSDVKNADYNPATGIFSNIIGDITYTYECGQYNENVFTETFTVTSSNPYVAVNESNFPDPVFRQYLVDNIDKNRDKILSYNEIQNVTELRIENMGIKDLTGIEYFPNLQFLECNYNKLTSLDTSKNSALTKLYCNDNELISINVSNNRALIRLECQDNNITSLDLSQNTDLEYLLCNYNYIQKKSDIVCLDESELEVCAYNPQYYEGYTAYYSDVKLPFSKVITNKERYLSTSAYLDIVGKPSDDIINKSEGIEFIIKYPEEIFSCNDSNVIINRNMMTVKKAGTYTIKLTIKNGKSAGVDIVKNFTITAIDLKDHTEHEYTVWKYDYDYETAQSNGHYQECFCGEVTETKPHVLDSEIVSGKDNNGNTINFKKCTVCNYYQEVNETTVITDNKTKVKLTALGETVLDSSLTLNVTEVENITMPSGRTALAYDITLTDGTKEVQPNGSIRITIPVPKDVDGSRTTVYRKESNGTYTNMKAMYNSKDNTLSFVTNHLSIYVIAENNSVKGDLNSDGIVDLKDLAVMKSILAEDDPAKYAGSADLNGDGKVDLKDLAALKYLLAEN